MAKRITRKMAPFQVGDKVWLDNRNLKLEYPFRKIAFQRKGPFKITERIEQVAYWLKLFKIWKIHSMFHARLLMSYSKNPTNRPNFLHPSPDLIEVLRT